MTPQKYSLAQIHLDNFLSFLAMGNSVLVILFVLCLQDNIQHNEAVDIIGLNPCRFMCHMQHSMDQCKLVSTTKQNCVNFYWTGSGKDGTVVDRVPDDEYGIISTAEAIDTLKIGKNGCERLCEEHPACVDNGSECKDSGVCLNLFWHKGVPSREQMRSCYQLADEGCDDGTPILCGPGISTTTDSVTAASNTANPATKDASSGTDFNNGNEPKKQPAMVSSKTSRVSMTTATNLLIIPFITWGR